MVAIVLQRKVKQGADMNEPDWQLICNQLRRHKPLARIAKEVGSDERHLNRLARGEVKQPKFMVGVKLLDLHYDHCQ